MARKGKRITEEDELESAYRHISGYKGKYKKTRSLNHTPVIITISIAIIAILVCIAAGYLYFLNKDLDGIIQENVTVAGVNVGGMSQAEAITAVRAATDYTYSKIPMLVKVLDSKAEIPVSCVGKLDVRGAVRAAYKFGNSGSADKQQREQQLAMSTGYSVDLTPYLDLNQKGIQKILSALGADYSSTLSQSIYEITGTAPEQILVIKLGVPEYGLDLDQLYRQVLEAYSANQFEITGQLSVIEPEPINLESIYKEYYVPPENAYFDAINQEIVAEVNGYGFDLEYAKSILSKKNYGATIEIPFTELKPEITTELLSSLLFRDKLAVYTATATSNANRNTNLRLACEAINGFVLYPGDVFSYNERLGERTTARGYRPAPSCEENSTVLTVGSGICQVSSALYYCALKAEMQIELRENHGFMPSYMPLGFDATVGWGSIDFMFKNTLDYPVRIEASASGGKTTVALIGTDLRDYRVELNSEILSTTEYKISYKTMSANNADGYKDGDYIVEPHTGYEINTYLCRYALDSDTLLSRELIANSVYRKCDAIVCKIDNSNVDTGTTDEIPGIGGGGITDDDGALPS